MSSGQMERMGMGGSPNREVVYPELPFPLSISLKAKLCRVGVSLDCTFIPIRYSSSLTGSSGIIMSGDLALNVKANSAVQRYFKRPVWV